MEVLILLFAFILVTAVFFVAVMMSITSSIKELRRESEILRLHRRRQQESNLSSSERARRDADQRSQDAHASRYDGGGW